MIKQELELYATGRTIVGINDEVKIKIMHALEKEEKNFDEIVKLTEKAKSTISKHLEKLEKDGLIISGKNSADYRKKTYKKTANMIGAVSKPKPILCRKTLEHLDTSEPFKFMNSLFRSMRYVLESQGLSTESTLHSIGEQIGCEISKRMHSKNTDDLFREIKQFWTQHKLGEIKIIQKNPLIFNVYGCYECSNMPNIGKTLCAFDEGIFEAIFKQRLGKKVTVKEVECFGSGFDHCKFIVL